MKRKLFALILSILLLSSGLLMVSAATSPVQDFANLMTSTEKNDLIGQIQSIRNSYGLDVVILTIPNLMGKSAQDFADDFYENNRYSPDGVLFLVDMGSRQWHLSTSGTAIEALSDRDLMTIEDLVIPYFSEGRYYEGFRRFLEILPDHLNNGSSTGVNFLISLLGGAAIAGISIFIMIGTMNTKKPQRSAENYMTEGTYQLRQHQDLFLYSNISRREKPKNNSSGSSSHRSASGSRHGGRGGRF